ncbi:MAG: conjugal transfer protein TraG N-terminal domain-containing protein [Salinisphaeraceae bacterium]
MYEIFAIGDSRFLFEVMKGIALITNTDDFRGLVSVGFLLGVLLVSIRAVMDTKFEIQHALIAFIIYGVMFIPKGTVIIEDVYTGATQTVDNVPVGVAAIGQTVSTIGVALTELFEQGFSPVGSTTAPYEGIFEEAFTKPLYALLNLRNVTFSPDGPQGQLRHNIPEYVARCTMRGISDRRLDPDSIYTDPYAWDGIKYPSATSYMLYKENTGSYDNISCLAATGRIENMLSSIRSDGTLRARVNDVLSINDIDHGEDYVENVLHSLLDNGIDANRWMLNSIFMRYVDEGMQKGYISRGDTTAAMLLEENRNRRNLKLSLNGSTFQEIMQPVMTFLETFVYAVSPLVAFLVVLGPMGIKLASKYLLITIWVQLWLPIMAIIKLYAWLVINRDMETFASGSNLDAAIGSMQGLWRFNATLADWIGVTGMLIAATPALVLMLLYGSAITATALARNLASAEGANEAFAAPSPASNSGLATKVGQMSASIDNAGQATYGFNPEQDSASGTIQASTAMSNATTASMQATEKAMSSTASNFMTSEGVMNAAGQLRKTSDTSSTGTSSQLSESFSAEVKDILGQGFSRELGLNERQARALNLTSHLSGGFGIGNQGAGAQAQVRAAAENLSKTEYGKTEQGKSDVQSLLKISTDQDQSTQLMQTVSRSQDKSTTDSISRMVQQQDQDSYTETKAAISEMNESLSESQAFQQQISGSSSIAMTSLQASASQWAQQTGQDFAGNPQLEATGYREALLGGIREGDVSEFIPGLKNNPNQDAQALAGSLEQFQNIYSGTPTEGPEPVDMGKQRQEIQQAKSNMGGDFEAERNRVENELANVPDQDGTGNYNRSAVGVLADGTPFVKQGVDRLEDRNQQANDAINSDPKAGVGAASSFLAEKASRLLDGDDVHGRLAGQYMQEQLTRDQDTFTSSAALIANDTGAISLSDENVQRIEQGLENNAPLSTQSIANMMSGAEYQEVQNLSGQLDDTFRENANPTLNSQGKRDLADPEISTVIEQQYGEGEEYRGAGRIDQLMGAVDYNYSELNEERASQYGIELMKSNGIEFDAGSLRENYMDVGDSGGQLTRQASEGVIGAQEYEAALQNGSVAPPTFQASATGEGDSGWFASLLGLGNDGEEVTVDPAKVSETFNDIRAMGFKEAEKERAQTFAENDAEEVMQFESPIIRMYDESKN